MLMPDILLDAILYLHRKLMKLSLPELNGNKQLTFSGSHWSVPKEPFLSAIFSGSHRISLFSVGLYIFTFPNRQSPKSCPSLRKTPLQH